MVADHRQTQAQPTAMLLARRGLKVAALDRTAHGSDTLSTHALMRGAVLQLHRWGVLDTILAASLIGLVFGLVYGLATKSLNGPFGFGPAIAAGAGLALFVPWHAWLLGGGLAGTAGLG